MYQEYQIFTLRGLCKDSDIDRGYFLMGGESRDNNGRLKKDRAEMNGVSDEIYHMKPVYEGYFYTIHWVPTVMHKSNGMTKTFKASKN